MADMTGLVAGVRTQLAVLATSVADKLDEMDAAVAGARDKVAGSVEKAAGEDDSPEPGSLDFSSPPLQSPDNHTPDDLDGPEPDGYDEGEEAGLELDMEDVDTSDEKDQAGSSEIEGVGVEDEGEEI